MAKVQYYGIKFPFTSQKVEKYYVDLNSTSLSYVRSQIMHVLFTLKGTKLMDPLFGTNLIKYIFDQNDSSTWNSVKDECAKAINKYVTNCSLTNITIAQSDNDMHEIFVKIEFTVTDNGKTINDSIITKV